MKRPFLVQSAIWPVAVCLLLAPLVFAPMCRAESASHAAKHARKVAKKLARYPNGTYVKLVFRDRSQTLGTVDTLKADSFTFMNADTNARATYRYADVAAIKKGRTFVGKGSVRRHRPRFLIPVFAGVAAAGAAFAMAGVP